MHKRKIIAVALLFTIVFSVSAQERFQPTLQSFEANYECPKWFRDAKFGIWAHWGPQAVPRQGDHYARKLYMSDDYDKKTKSYTGKPNPDYTYHLAHYGHPSKVGYKDIIPLWKAERFDPEKLMALYKRVGAKYFVSMGTHHDNFFLWNSKIHRWNAVSMGPHKDIVALWQAAAKKEGLRFGVSEHLAASYNWFQPSHGSDKKGPMAGIPYDGANPEYQDLYHPDAAIDDTGWMTKNPINQKNWYNSITELIDNYHPDLLYSDSNLPFGIIGRKMLSHFYNDNIKNHNGQLEAVYNCKLGKSNPMWVLDIERGLTDSITPFPWQTDTSIGDWFYRTGQKYKNANEIIQMLVDIVSKNGNLLLNVVQTPEGDLDEDVVAILEQVATWISINGEGIYGSRPWKIYGEGPSITAVKKPGQFGGISDADKNDYSQADFRFTTKGDTLYAFCLATPTKDIKIVSLAKNAALSNKRIASVKLLGSKNELDWHQSEEGLIIKKPSSLPNSPATVFKIEFK